MDYNNFNDFTYPNPDTLYWDSSCSMASGFTFLMKLVMMVVKYPEVIDMIKNEINKNPDEIDKKNSNGSTALMIAINHVNCDSNIECVKLLIDKGANVNSINNNGYTPVMLSCMNTPRQEDKIDCLQLLLDSGANISNSINVACIYSNNSTEYAKILIDKGADVNHKDSRCVTPLMLALKNLNYLSSFECVKLLINNGANVNDTDINGWSPLMYAMHHIERSDEYKCILFLIENGADINHVDNYGHTVLMHLLCYSLEHSNIYIINILKKLIDMGIDINRTDNNGWSALMYATIKKPMLFNTGLNYHPYFDINDPMLQKSTYFWYNNNENFFSICENFQIINILVNNGVDCTNVSSNGWSALMCLFYNYRIDEKDTQSLINIILLSDKILSLKSSENKTAFDYYSRNKNIILSDYYLGILNKTEASH